MLVVKVEIWDGGRSSDKRDLARLLLANLSDLADVSSYLAVRLGPDGAFDERVVHRHRRSDGPWVLIRRAIDDHDAATTPVPDELRATVVAMLTALTTDDR
jgi:hypothetical protein